MPYNCCWFRFVSCLLQELALNRRQALLGASVAAGSMAAASPALALFGFGEDGTKRYEEDTLTLVGKIKEVQRHTHACIGASKGFSSSSKDLGGQGIVKPHGFQAHALEEKLVQIRSAQRRLSGGLRSRWPGQSPSAIVKIMH